MKLLVTGGCGFIGSNLLASLSDMRDINVTVLDNEVMGKREHIDRTDISFIKGDIRDSSLLNNILSGFDSVVHLAADTRVIDSIENPVFNFENNVIGTFNLLNAMRKNGVMRLVIASTGGAILGEVKPPVHEGMVAKPMSAYGASKLAAEGYLSAYSSSYGINATALRFSNVYGPRSFHKGSVVAAFYKRILKGQSLIVFGDGTQTRDYIYVHDICSGIISALTSDTSGVFQLGTGIPTTINDLISRIRNIVNVNFDVVYEPPRRGEIINTYCDISKAEAILKFKPLTPLNEGLRNTWEWFLSSAK